MLYKSFYLTLRLGGQLGMDRDLLEAYYETEHVDMLELRSNQKLLYTVNS